MLESIKGLNVVEKKGVPFLQFEIFKNQPVIHGFSTRLGGVSRGEWSSMNISFTCGDNEADVKENHERLAAAVGYRTEDLVLTQQVHKTDILRVGKEDTGDVYRYPNQQANHNQLENSQLTSGKYVRNRNHKRRGNHKGR